ncbi:flagellar basal body P-ring formation protein FlgA [Erwinia sp. CPCC 100877]|nr:flagellar basal body P-ring formation protein FlgA [Erwinia sp. CPCC 100877]
MPLYARVRMAVFGLSGLVTLALVNATPVWSAERTALAEQIEAQLNARHADKGIVHKVTIKTPQAQWPDCQRPKLTLPNGNRLTGNMSVAVQCERKHFLQVTVEAEGRYWVAEQAIQAGEAITGAQIGTRSGSLSKLPAGLAFQPQEIVGSVATRAFRPGQPIIASQLRKSWRVKTGEEVDVMLTGEGFRIRGRGKAMNNAAVDELARIRMASGQIISGRVMASGEVVVQQ